MNVTILIWQAAMSHRDDPTDPAHREPRVPPDLDVWRGAVALTGD